MGIYKPGRAKEYKPFATDNKNTVPKTKGEYRILDKDRKIQYIGYANNLERRMKEHIKAKKLNKDNGIFAFKCADGRASRDKLAEHERQKIKKHTPPLNKRAGGAGRPFKRKAN